MITGHTHTAIKFSRQIKSCDNTMTPILNAPYSLQDSFCDFVQAAEKMELKQIDNINVKSYIGMTNISKILVSRYARYEKCGLFLLAIIDLS